MENFCPSGTFSSQLQNKSFRNVGATRTAAQRTMTKNVREKRPKLAFFILASPADSLGDSSRIPPRRARGGGTRDESLRESAGEAIFILN